MKNFRNGIVFLTLSSLVILAQGSHPETGIEGIEFTYDQKTGEWKADKDLPNLGIDMRDVKLPILQPNPRQLFPQTSNGKIEDDRSLFFCRDYKCEAKEEQTYAPCGKCQDSNEFFLLSAKNSNSALVKNCFKLVECVDKADGDCDRGTANCFQSVCPTTQIVESATGFAWQGMCNNIRFTGDCRLDRTNSCIGTACTCVGIGCPGNQRQLHGKEWKSDGVVAANSLARTYIGFVRVPKTGSSTLLKFLDQQRYMLQWNTFVSEDVADDKTEGSSSSATSDRSATKQRSSPGTSSGACIFGKPISQEELEGIQERDLAWWNSCGHYTYGKLVEQWARSLPLWKQTPAIVDGPAEDLTMTLQAFTMVRDPFDRLTSYFFYLRKFSYTNNFLMDTVSKTQYRFVEDNDLEGWLHQLYVEKGGRGLELPYQYKYLHPNVDEAIQLIQNDARPQVYALLTECYEVSLRLLAQSLGHFDETMIDDFIGSDDYSSNNNKEMYKEKPSEAELARIRKHAEVWFADDFKFYEAVVGEFVEKMLSSGLDPQVLETCVHWNGSTRV